MLATPHLLAGAAITKEVKPRWLALTAAFASHFVLDFIPHIDSYGLFGIPGGPKTPLELTSVAIDTLLGVALLFWAVSKHPERRLLLLGGFLAVLVDIIYYIPPWGSFFRALPVLSQMGEFHTRVQHNLGRSELLIGFVTQAFVVLIALIILRKQHKTKQAK